jgi:leader peptidase (prepilin peptidase)/N-methyltransferase
MVSAITVGAALFGAAAATCVFLPVRAGVRSRPHRPAWQAVPVGAAAAGGFGAVAGPSPLLPVLMLGVVLGLLLADADLRTLRLPDPLVAALAVVVAVPVALPGGSAARACLAAALTGSGYLALALLPGDGLGLGDVKLAAVLGFLLGWFGWPTVLAGVVLPHLINGPVALWLLLRRRAGRRTALPFGPALLAGAALAITVTA